MARRCRHCCSWTVVVLPDSFIARARIRQAPTPIEVISSTPVNETYPLHWKKFLLFRKTRGFHGRSAGREPNPNREPASGRKKADKMGIAGQQLNGNLGAGICSGRKICNSSNLQRLASDQAQVDSEVA